MCPMHLGPAHACRRPSAAPMPPGARSAAGVRPKVAAARRGENAAAVSKKAQRSPRAAAAMAVCMHSCAPGQH